MTSVLMMDQHERKKVPLKPSGPGDFSCGDFQIATHTSSSVKGLSRLATSRDGRWMDSQLMVRLRGDVVPNEDRKCS